MAEIHQERRWRKLPEGKANPSSRGPAGAGVGPTGPTWQGLGPWLLPVSFGSFPRPVCDISVADKFCGKYALESLF